MYNSECLLSCDINLFVKNVHMNTFIKRTCTHKVCQGSNRPNILRTDKQSKTQRHLLPH